MAVWRWDKKEPILRFPLKDPLTAFRVVGSIAVGATDKGSILVWDTMTGALIGELDQAHYMAITDLDVNPECDMVATGGRDGKVKVWALKALIDKSNTPMAELTFNAEVCKVVFSKTNSDRLFIASIDKTFKAFEISSKVVLRTIVAPAPILLMTVDVGESNVYLACDNLNVYCYAMEWLEG
jgi:WD40 repeat protein